MMDQYFMAGFKLDCYLYGGRGFKVIYCFVPTNQCTNALSMGSLNYEDVVTQNHIKLYFKKNMYL